MKSEVSLFDIIFKLFKHRWFIFKTVLIITVLSLIISLIIPKTYKSTVRFFPPPREGGGMGGLFSNFLQPMVSTSELKSEAILVVLQSRSLKESVIRKFKLDQVYGTDIMELLLKKLDANLEINDIREGGFGFNPLLAVELSYLDKNPIRVKAVTQYYVSKMDSIIKKLNQERALSTSRIIEKRYRQNIRDLQKAENALKEFQEKYGIFEIETQTKSIIEKLAELKTQIIQIEIQIDVLKKMTSRDNTQLQKLRVQKASLEKKYSELVNASDTRPKDQVFQPLSKMPELAAKYSRLYREVLVQNKIYEYVYPQYEQAKLQASTQSHGIQILDMAELPTYKEKPKRLFIVLSGFLFSLFLSFTILFIKEVIESEKSKNSQNFQKLVFIKDTLKKEIIFWEKTK